MSATQPGQALRLTWEPVVDSDDTIASLFAELLEGDDCIASLDNMDWVSLSCRTSARRSARWPTICATRRENHQNRQNVYFSRAPSNATRKDASGAACQEAQTSSWSPWAFARSSSGLSTMPPPAGT